MPHILIAHNDRDTRRAWATQLITDGYDAHDANTVRNATETLATEPIRLLMLGALQHPAEAPALLVDLRAGRLDPIIDQQLPVLTLGATDQVTQLRAYDSGGDHHVASDIDYLVLRAVIAALLRRTGDTTRCPRCLRLGPLTIDRATREVRVDGTLIRTTKREFALLTALASDPARVFTKHELLRELWGQEYGVGTTRTLDSHACRLRTKLAAHGQRMVIAEWGVGYRLTNPV